MGRIHISCCWFEIILIRLRVVIMSLEHISIVILKTDTDEVVCFLSLIIWSLIIDNIVFFHESRTNLPFAD